MFVKHECPPAATKSELAIFSIKVTDKITRPLTLVSFERVSLIEYTCQIRSLFLLWFKSHGQDLSFFGTNRRTDRVYRPGIVPAIMSTVEQLGGL